MIFTQFYEKLLFQKSVKNAKVATVDRICIYKVDKIVGTDTKWGRKCDAMPFKGGMAIACGKGSYDELRSFFMMAAFAITIFDEVSGWLCHKVSCRFLILPYVLLINNFNK